MNRRQIAFLVLANAVLSFVIALGVAWAIELRRPDPEALLANIPPSAQIAVAAAPAVPVNSSSSQNTSAQPQSIPTNTPGASDGTGNVAAIVSTTAEAPLEVLEYYIVEAGDTLLGIAQRYDLTIDEIMEANNLNDPDFVFSGQQLAIPDISNRPAASSSDNTSDESNEAPEGVLITAVDGVGKMADENVLVVNDSSNSFNLQGWTLSAQDGPIYTFGNLPLFPGGSIRLYSTSGTDSSIALYWGQSDALWAAGRDIRLVDGQGNLVYEYVVADE